MILLAMPRLWREAVWDAVLREAARSSDRRVTRSDLIDRELGRIVAETGSVGLTPEQTLSRELQQLRDEGLLEFVEDGVYRVLS